MPLTFLSEDRGGEVLRTLPHLGVARIKGTAEGLLCDALGEPSFCAAVLEAVREGRRFPVASGEVNTSSYARFAELRGPLEEAVPTSTEMMIFIGRHLPGGGAPGLQLVAPCLAATEEQALADLAVIESCPVLERAEVAVERQATDVRERTAASALTYPEEHRDAVDNVWTSASAATRKPRKKSAISR